MKLFKIVNELTENQLRYLYKDIKYNWSNNIDHCVDMTDVVFKDDNDNYIKESIFVKRAKGSDTISVCTDKREFTVGNVEDFKIAYFIILNVITGMKA